MPLNDVLSRMPSEVRCIRCGCVRARHPARYCTHCGPSVCKAFRDIWDYLFVAAVLALIIVWALVFIETMAR